MVSITLPRELEEWAQGEVAAGRGRSVAEVAANAIARYRAHIDALRADLDAAEDEAEHAGWLDADDVFAELRARFPDRA